jgi:hypothetical protein
MALPVTFALICGLAVVVARRPRIAAFHALMAAVTVVLALAVLEVSAALRYVHWYLIFERVLNEKEFASGFDADPVLGWRRRPNLRWSERVVGDLEGEWSLPPERDDVLSFTYDARGYRNPATLERADVALVGDSHVEGAYNDDHEVIARRLEARLGRPVANMGVAGYGTRQEYLVIERDVPKFAPKVVVWFFFEGNDLYEDQVLEDFMSMPLSEARGVSESEGIAVYHDWRIRSFVHNALPRLRRWADPLFPNHAPYYGILQAPGTAGVKVLFAEYAAKPWTDFESDRWNKAVDTLRAGIALSRERGFALLLAFVPIKFRVYRPFVALPVGSPVQAWDVWPIREYFMEFCRAEGAACIDLTAPFQRALAGGRLPYARTDTHWSAEGHDVAAHEIEAEIRARDWLVRTAR